MSELDRIQLKEVEDRMGRFEQGQDEILLLLRGPLNDPGKGLVAAVKRLEENQEAMQKDIDKLSMISHSAPCPYLAGAETTLGKHMDSINAGNIAREEKKKKLEDRTWEVIKPLLVQFLGAVLGGSVIAWVMSLLSG